MAPSTIPVKWATCSFERSRNSEIGVMSGSRSEDREPQSRLFMTRDLVQSTVEQLAGRPNRTGDFLFSHTNPSRDGVFDLLIFADSRGFSIENPLSSWTSRLFRYAKRKQLSAVVVVRPRDLTGLFTLYNFLKASPLQFRSAVCQVGLGEFTPKTDDALQDLRLQHEVHFRDHDFSIRSLDKMLVIKSDGPVGEPLAQYEQTYTIDISSPAIESAFVSLLESRFDYSLILGALALDKAARLARMRPASFFDQVRQSNAYLCDLAKGSRSIHYLEPIKGWRTDSSAFLHDGAHYTDRTHGSICEVVKAILAANFPEE